MKNGSKTSSSTKEYASAVSVCQCVSVCVYRWVRHDFYVSFFIYFFFQFFGRMFTSVPSFLLCHVKKKKLYIFIKNDNGNNLKH